MEGKEEEGRTHNIAQQLQTLLQIPAISQSVPNEVFVAQQRPRTSSLLATRPSNLDLNQRAPGNLSNSISSKAATIKKKEAKQNALEANNGLAGGPEMPDLGKNQKEDDEPAQKETHMIEYLKELFRSSFHVPLDIKNSEDLLGDNMEKVRRAYDLSSQYQLLDSRVKQLLKTHFVDALAKKIPRLEEAKYLCAICRYDTATLTGAIEHICSERHYKQAVDQRRKYTLKAIPLASQQHCEAIGRVLVKTLEQNALSHADLTQRDWVVQYISKALRNIDCKVAVFGSSFTGIGFKTSDLNINVTIDELKTVPVQKAGKQGAAENVLLISRVVDIIANDSNFNNVVPMKLSQKTQILFLSSKLGTGVKCVIHFNNYSGVQFADLVNQYINIHPIITPIITAFRYWARICGLDNQEGGLLAPHSFVIMALKYFQKVEIVPILHAIPTHNKNRSFATAAEAFKAGFNNRSTESYNKVDLGRVWMSLFHFYACEFFFNSHVISINRINTMDTQDRIWSKRISIEDPIFPMANLTRGTTSNKVCDYIIDKIKHTFMYFAIPRTIHGPVYDGILNQRFVDRQRQFIRIVMHQIGKDAKDDAVRIMDLDPIDSPDPDPSIVRLRVFRDIDHTGKNLTIILLENVKLAHNFLRAGEYFYEFNKVVFNDGSMGPVITCKACGNEGHLRRHCPEENLPPLIPLPMPSPECCKIIAEIMLLNFDRENLNNSAYQTRIRIKEEVKNLLIDDFPDIELKLFGSSENGFGMRNSDLDVCILLRRFPGSNKDEIGRAFNFNEALERVERNFQNSNVLCGVYSITGAKVPIVKFSHRLTRIHGDICFYNTLALHNTRLLRIYSDLDPRVKVLSCFLKKLGKICEISDASKGSLSSYGYMLMLIHYFQHTAKPVLPVLQELPPAIYPKGVPLPVVLVDNCNVYFFDKVSQVRQVWDHEPNSDSTQQLWLGFLKYYTEEFDFENMVVSISQFAPVTRKAKCWFTGCIAIEDPFEKGHNLGSGLSRRMSVHIIKTLRNFRTVFHTALDNLDLVTASNFLFDPKNITDGSLPIDRQCRRCHRIGHIARNCAEYERERDVIDQVTYDYPSEEELEPVVLKDAALSEETKKSVQAWVMNVKGSAPHPPPGFLNLSPIHPCNPPISESPVREEVAVQAPFPVMPTQPNLQPQTHPMFYHGQPLCYPMPITAMPWMPQRPPPEPSQSVLPEFRFFANMQEPRDNIDLFLLRVVESSNGVAFTDQVVEKVKRKSKNLLPEEIKKLAIIPRVRDNEAAEHVPAMTMMSQHQLASNASIPQQQQQALPPPGFAPRQPAHFNPMIVNPYCRPIFMTGYPYPMVHHHQQPTNFGNMNIPTSFPPGMAYPVMPNEYMMRMAPGQNMIPNGHFMVNQQHHPLSIQPVQPNGLFENRL